MKVDIRTDEGLAEPQVMLGMIRRACPTGQEAQVNMLTVSSEDGSYYASIDNIEFGEGYILLRAPYENPRTLFTEGFMLIPAARIKSMKAWKRS